MPERALKITDEAKNAVSEVFMTARTKAGMSHEALAESAKCSRPLVRRIGQQGDLQHYKDWGRLLLMLKTMDAEQALFNVVKGEWTESGAFRVEAVPAPVAYSADQPAGLPVGTVTQDQMMIPIQGAIPGQLYDRPIGYHPATVQEIDRVVFAVRVHGDYYDPDFKANDIILVDGALVESLNQPGKRDGFVGMWVLAELGDKSLAIGRLRDVGIEIPDKKYGVTYVRLLGLPYRVVRAL